MLLPHAPHEVVAFLADGSRTAGQLRTDVGAVLACMAHEPVAPRRAVTCQGRYAFAVATLACWERGEVVILPLNHAPAVLADLAIDATPLHDGQGPGLDVRACLGASAAPAALRRPAPERVLVELSTSGSTGAVRFHPKTARQLLGEVDVLAATFAPGHGCRVVATIPPHHVYGLLFSILLPLAVGGALHDDAPLFPEAVAARVASVHADILVTVPAHLRTLPQLEGDALASLERVFSSGGPLPADTAEAFADRFGLQVTEVFGSTETGGIAWRQRGAGLAWAPLTGVQVDEDADGRLLLHSPFLAADDPIPRPCDDRIERLADGRFHHLGRMDDVVKIASKRVSISAVTATLLTVPGVDDAVVIAIDEPGGRVRLHALVAPASVDPQRLRQTLLDTLDAVAVPRIHLRDRLPRQPNGKLPRAAVLAALHPPAAPSGHVPADSAWFEGHFPGDPILPGLAQLMDWVLPEVRRQHPHLGPLRALRRLRFRRVVRPDDVLTVHLDHPGGTAEVRFEVRCGDQTCTSGTLSFG